jgi:hypothetical protein
MNDNQVKALLQNMLEDEVPAEQIQLWPEVRASLVAGRKFIRKQGVEMYKPIIRKMALAVLAALVLVSGGFATPQGRAVAQGLLELFRRADGRSMIVPAWQTASPEAVEGAPTAQPPAPLTSIAEAEAVAGFKAAEFSSAPAGLQFLGARLYGNAISLEYGAPEGGSLILMQSREGFLESDWNRVPSADIVPVRIGDVEGEFTQGTFVLLPGATSATWNSDAPILRLRWQKGGIWYEMTWFAQGGAMGSLDQTALTSLAQGLDYPAP